VGDNPANYVDPSGRDIIGFDFGGLGAVLLGSGYCFIFLPTAALGLACSLGAGVLGLIQVNYEGQSMTLGQALFPPPVISAY